jgi:hypoxanthine phosphoribosyltransferase
VTAQRAQQLERLVVSWQDLDRLVEVLARQIGPGHDVILAIARGGLVPAGMLAYRLGIRAILVAAAARYDDTGDATDEPTFLEFPGPNELRGRRVLIVDEVWDSGITALAVVERVRAAGGEPTIAVLHYKPGRSRVAARPDHAAAETEAWVVYPFKAGR